MRSGHRSRNRAGQVSCSVHAAVGLLASRSPPKVKRLEVLDDAARESVRGNGGVWQRTIYYSIPG